MLEHISSFRIGSRQIIKVLELIALCVGIPAALTFVVDLRDRRDSRTTQAWELLAIDSRGNSGKVNALQYLNEEKLEWWRYPKKTRESLAGIDLSSDEMPGIYLEEVNLNNANLISSDFGNTSLRGATFRGAKMLRAVFTGSALSDVDFSAIIGCQISDCETGDCLTEDSCTDLREADFSGLRIDNVNFSNADLRGADFSSAIISDSDFSGAQGWMADFSDTLIYRSCFNKYSSFSSQHMGGNSFLKSRIVQSDLRYADMSHAYMVDATITGSDISATSFGDHSPAFINGLFSITDLGGIDPKWLGIRTGHGNVPHKVGFPFYAAGFPPNTGKNGNLEIYNGEKVLDAITLGCSRKISRMANVFSR